MTRLTPCARIGVLGGGQLGRMLAVAGARLGLDIVIFDPEPDCPASRVAAETVTAAYDDLGAVARFAKSVDAVTYEFENVPVATALEAAKHAPLRPGANALEAAQDRLTEKTFLNNQDAPTVTFRAVDTPADARAAAETLGVPSILKTRRFGYDGKGQQVVRDIDHAEAAFQAIGGQEAILEAFAPFTRELSIVAARSLDGEVRAFPLSENRHEGGILRETIAPADADDDRLDARVALVADRPLHPLEPAAVVALVALQRQHVQRLDRHVDLGHVVDEDDALQVLGGADHLPRRESAFDHRFPFRAIRAAHAGIVAARRVARRSRPGNPRPCTRV